jgi:hypothetical protein
MAVAEDPVRGPVEYSVLQVALEGRPVEPKSRLSLREIIDNGTCSFRRLC